MRAASLRVRLSTFAVFTAASVAAATALRPESCTWPLLAPGTGIRGKAFKKVPSATTAAECCAACIAEGDACAAWVLQKSHVGAPTLCRLKSGSGGGFDCGELCVAAARRPSPTCPSSSSSSPLSPRTWNTSARATRGRVSAGAAPRPHIFVFLQDDLGHDDVAFYGNDANMDVTGNISAAAAQGVILERHYVHWHCSPTRRSFLTGRLPLHHSEYLSAVSTGDDIDLRWQTIGHKLRQAGYKTHWYGKGHTGYKSWNHLPRQLGFDDFIGFLGGAQDHFASKRWEGNCPLDDANNTYSADLYGRKALETLDAYDPGAPDAAPLFFYLPWQNVHTPYQAPRDWQGDVLRGMLASSDRWFGEIVAALKKKGMWDNTAIFYSADNGGTDLGSNWPLRGGKHSNWEGGMRAAAFISGGLVPAAARGTTSRVISHIADWYSTACALANGGWSHEACADDPPVHPLPVNPADPCIGDRSVPCKDIYGNASYPAVDGVDVWKAHTDASSRNNVSFAHSTLWLSAEVMLSGDYKLLVAQQDPAKSANPPLFGWKCNNPSLNSTKRCNTLHSADEPYFNATPAECACGCAFKHRRHLNPCLFDVTRDPSEFHPLRGSQAAAMRDALWKNLNMTNLQQFGRAPGPRRQGSSPLALLGKCNPDCAQAYFAKFLAGDPGPECGVPACE